MVGGSQSESSVLKIITMKTVIVLLALAVAVAYSQTTMRPTTAPTTATTRPGFLASFFRPMVTGGAGAINGGLRIFNSSVSTGAGLANTIGQGLIGGKQQLTNMGLGAANQSLGFVTSLAADFAAIGQNLASVIPIPGLASLASVGSGLVTMGANMVRTGGELAIGTIQSAANAKYGIKSAALEMGTGIAGSLASSGVGMAQSGVTMGAGMATSMIDTGDQMVTAGTNMMAQGMAMVTSAAEQASTMGSQLQNTLGSAMPTPLG